MAIKSEFLKKFEIYKLRNMKKLLSFTLATAIVGLTAFSNLTELPLGAEIPNADVKMKDVSGKSISLKEAKKPNGLLVMFSCNTCPYVVKNQERTIVISKYAQENNIGVVLINSNEALRGKDDSFDAMKSYAKQQGYQWNYVVDEKSAIADAFGATRTPETFLFNKDGKLVYHGAIDDNPSEANAVNRKHLKEAIDESLKGQNVTVQTSRSVGCSIKRL